MTEAVLRFIAEQAESDRKIMQDLHDIFMAVPEMECKIRYHIPFYYRNSWVCYLNPQRKGGVEWALIRGNELEIEDKKLQARGRKQVLGVIYQAATEIEEDWVRTIFYEAILLDENKPYASKRKKL